MQTNNRVQEIVEPIIDNLGFEVVRVQLSGNVKKTLQIMIERKDRKNIVVEDCATVSRAISDILDEKDPIEGEYSLEVSSPGLDRPLTKLEHFQRFAGYEAKVETNAEVDGRKRFKGKVLSVDAKNNILLEMEGAQYAIPFDDVNKAKLVLTDELWAAYEAEQEAIEL